MLSPPSAGLSAGEPIKGNWSNAKRTRPGLSSFSRSSATSSSANSATTVDPKSASAPSRAQAKVEPLIANGQYAAAQQVLQTYVHAYPRDKTLRAQLAKVATKNAQQQLATAPEAAATAARTAVWADPNNQTAKDVLAQALKKVGVNTMSANERLKVADNLLAQGKPTEAEVEFDEALKLKPSAEGHVGLGDVALHQGKRDKAKTEYQRALEINPNSSLALRQMGLLRYQQGEVVGANTDLSRALVLNPKDGIAAKQLIDLWQHQVAHNPNGVNGHLGLARAYQLSGDLKSAQGEYRQVVRIDPQNPNLPAARQSFKLALARQEGEKAVEAAHTLENQGLLADAHNKVLEAVGLCPGNVSMRLYQAQLSQKLGSYSEAHQAYMDVLRVDPKNEEAAIGLKSLPPMAAPSVVNNDMPPLAPPINPAASSAAGGTAMGLAATAGSLFTPNTVPGGGGAVAAPQLAANSSNYAQNVMPGTGAISMPPTAGSAAAATGANSYVKPYDTAPHINTLSGFFGQIRGLAAAQTASSMANQAASSPASSLGIGELAGFGGAGTAAAAAAGSAGTVQALSAEATPHVDAGGLEATLAKANAALKAAGINPTAPGAASSAAAATPAVAPDAPPAASAPIAPPASIDPSLGIPASSLPSLPASGSGIPGGNPGGPSSLLGFANSLGSGMQQVSAGVNGNNNGAALAQLSQYASLLQGPNGQPLSDAQLNSLYQQYRPTLQQRFGMQLPQNLPPNASAQLAAVQQGAGANSELQVAYQRVGSLEQQNQQLKDQLAQLQALRTGQNAEPPNVVPVTLPTTGQTGSSAMAPEATALLPSATGGNTASSNAMAIAAATPNAVPALVNNANSAGQPVKLELVGVQPTPLDIRLKVMLRNAQNSPINVPTGTHAVILMNGKTRVAKVSFPSSSVPANGHLQGIIKVAGHDLNPSADLWLPNFLPGTGGDRDLHLTVPISSLPLNGTINTPASFPSQ